MDLKKTGCPKDLAFHSHHPSASVTWVGPCSSKIEFRSCTETQILFILWFYVLQWNRSSSCVSTCTKLAACSLPTAQVCLILSRESSSRHRVRSQRSVPRNLIWLFLVSIFSIYMKRVVSLSGAAGDAVSDLGPAAGFWERGAVWRGLRTERWPSNYCHWTLWSRHSGETEIPFTQKNEFNSLHFLFHHYRICFVIGFIDKWFYFTFDSNFTSI